MYTYNLIKLSILSPLQNNNIIYILINILYIMLRRVTKEEKSEAVDAVRNGENYSVVARKVGVSLGAIHGWCTKEGVKTSFVHIKKTDSEIAAAIKEAKVVTQAELAQILNYQTLGNRLRSMIMRDLIKSTIIPGKSSAAKISWPIHGYQNRRLYYVDDDDLSEWLIEKLPPHMPIGMRRAVTGTLRSMGISLPLLITKKKVKAVSIDWELYETIREKANKGNTSICKFANRIIKEGLKSQKFK